jgi:phosphoglycolate phosphatase
VIKGVIFDLDGTLLDTVDDIADSMNFALKSNGFYEYVNDEYKYFVGKGVKNLVSMVLEDQTRDQKKHDKVLQMYLKKYAEIQHIKTKAYSGIDQLLIDLSLRGIQLAVLTNKPDGDSQKIVKRHFPSIPFEMIFGAHEGVPIKPNPTGALAILKRFELKPAEVLYVGDTNVDILTAQNAKIPSIGVLWGFRTRGELERAKADYIVAHPKEILEIIKEKNQ